MLKLAKYLKGKVGVILCIIALLGLQAWCDLALPGYTSRIVTEGLQQKGVEDAVPERMRAETLEDLQLFLSDEDAALLTESYTAEDRDEQNSAASDAVYELNAFGKENRDTLAQKLVTAELMLYIMRHPDAMESLGGGADSTAGTSSNSDSKIETEEDRTGNAKTGEVAGEISQTAKTQGGSTGEEASNSSTTALSGMGTSLTLDENTLGTFRKLPQALRQIILNQAAERMSQMPETITGQVGIRFVQEEYEALGEDLAKRQNSYLMQVGGRMLLVALLAMAAAITVTFLAARLAASTAFRLRGDVFRKVMSFHSQEFHQFSTASLITRSTNDIQQVQMLLAMGLRIVLYAPILGIGGIIKVLQTDTGMTWVIALAVGLLLGLIAVLFIVAMPRFTRLQSLIDRLNLVTREQLTGVMVTRAFSAEQREEERFEKENRILTRTNLFVNRCMTFMMPVMMLIMNGVSVLIIYTGAHAVDQGSMQVGDMMAFIQYTMQIIMSFLLISVMSILIPRANVAAKRIGEVLETETAIADPAQPGTPDPDLRGEVAFEHVTFRYPDAGENVLTDISFTAHRGETVAFIGSTGSGKSTLLNLIPRFYDVTEGSVKVDGLDVRAYKKEDLCARLGYVPQKSVLFSGTIASNILFGNGQAGEAVMENAAHIAQAQEFIDSKENGYDAYIAQGGTNVSGGQRQRLSIARAIAMQPEILLFDDSFSALDFKTDAALRRALRENAGQVTTLIVAQRISTILHADRIVVLDEGRVAGIGTHRELMENCEVYRQIATSQLSEEELAG